MHSATTLPEGYTIHDGPPSVSDYVHLRKASGLYAVTPTQAEGAIACTWYGVHIKYASPSKPDEVEVVGMARIFGGGWFAFLFSFQFVVCLLTRPPNRRYFHIADCATLPDHQKKGLGSAMMAALMKHLEENAEPGYYVNLLADVPGRKLYERFGFIDAMPRSLGMWKGSPR
ncbi:hypothetical protein ONZ45_g10196 [Pleurotus djamor]|nr:hypothetical protein ONZ45_g10196 [Pleurotus djamor]